MCDYLMRRDVAALHEKLDRTKTLAAENDAAKGSFQESFSDGLDRLLGSLADYQAAHAASCSEFAGRVGGGLAEGLAALGRLAAMVDQVRNTNSSALNQLEEAVKEHGAEHNR